MVAAGMSANRWHHMVRRRGTVQVFRVSRRWRVGARHFPPVEYHLANGYSGTLRRAIWLRIGPYEARVTL